jgi:hypothetical protein
LTFLSACRLVLSFLSYVVNAFSDPRWSRRPLHVNDVKPQQSKGLTTPTSHKSPTEHSSSSCCPTLDPGLVSRDGPRRLLRQSGSSCTPVRGPALGETSARAPAGSMLLIVGCESLRGSGSGCPHPSRSETCSLRRLAAFSRPAVALWLSSPRQTRRGSFCVRRMRSRGSATTRRSASSPIRMTPDDPSPARA